MSISFIQIFIYSYVGDAFLEFFIIFGTFKIISK